MRLALGVAYLLIGMACLLRGVAVRCDGWIGAAFVLLPHASVFLALWLAEKSIQIGDRRD